MGSRGGLGLVWRFFFYRVSPHEYSINHCINTALGNRKKKHSDFSTKKKLRFVHCTCRIDSKFCLSRIDFWEEKIIIEISFSSFSNIIGFQINVYIW